MDISTAPSITPPIAAAWLYMSDNQNYKTIPHEWSVIDFKMVDVLFVGPAGLQADGTFGLYHSDKTGPLAHRFKWVVQTARSQNPNIKIIVSQWWGSGDTIWGYNLSNLRDSQAIKKYADSVQAFLKTWLSVSGGVDGYDVDYETGNVVENAPDILAQIRSKLDALSKDSGGRPFYVTVSPSVVTHLAKAAPSLSYVNMQTYEGGWDLTPQNFLDMGLHSQQLLYGICPETGARTRSVEEVKKEYKSHNLAGVHLWRLNSDNYPYELQVQKEIHDFLHPSSK
jgi:GH18 family chitinase